MRAAMEVKFERGVYLPEVGLWLDPGLGKERAFVSHAHADHVASHEVTICSEATRGLMERRRRCRGEVRTYGYGEVFALDEEGRFEAELWPAGHVLGSAQILVRRREDGATLLYTGDFKTRAGEACEALEVKGADTLIMETTFGLPRYRMPEREEVLGEILGFVGEALKAGKVPMLGAYSLGKTQELLMALGRREAGLRFLVHGSAEKVTRYYEEQGYGMPAWEVLGGEGSWEGRVVIAPPRVLRSGALRAVENRVTAMVSGWGVDRGAHYRYGVERVFALSDHADYGELLRFVEMVQPERVLTLHGYADEFARDLRALGREAWSLTGENQLELF